MNLPSCQIFSVLGMGIGSLRVQKISKNGYVGRLEQGRHGVNQSWMLCVEVGCSKLDGRVCASQNLKALTQSAQRKAEDTEKDEPPRRRGRSERQRKKAPRMNADE